MTLRPYQQDAADAALEWMKRSAAPFIIDAATGAGKSHIIAEIAQVIHGMTGKRVLCLAPSAELVMQNREKFLATGNRASTFSASAGAKELRHPVVFGSPLTVKNKISRFQMQGPSGYALVILDEAHGITPTVRDIITAMREGNPILRVCGLTATPYRLGSGWIFQEHDNGRINGEDTAFSPYFAKCVYKIDARALIGMGYLTPPIIGAINASGYDTSGLALNSRGQFDADAVDRAYHGQGRKTAAIVGDVVAQAANRKGVMFFAATVKHAQEIMASLPPELSEIVTGQTPKAQRDSILKRFKAQQIKYLVNVSVLTTGFDASHVDLIAILRKTESVGLLQQIIGRGLRLHEGKTDCLVLDYTTNLEDHCPDGDLFAPVVKASKAGGGGDGMTCICPSCSYENMV
ncbi:MAG: DEAD/DEAH box helicase, partial [Burkholderiaceae bacterium]